MSKIPHEKEPPMDEITRAAYEIARVLDQLVSATWAVAHQQNHMINRLSVPPEILAACPWCKK